MRPILIFRKFNNSLFLGIPLSSTRKQGSFFFEFEFIAGVKSYALLVQLKTFDVKRLDRKIGMIKKYDFEKLEENLKNLIKL